MIVLVVLTVPVALWVAWRLARRARRAGHVPTPLAGIDTGVRHVYRVPGSKFLGPKRGF